MKALILFRSYHNNTKQVAEVMARQIEGLGHKAEVRDLRLRLPDLAGIDCVLIGAPTRMARVTWKALRALKRLRKKGFGAKPLAVFDTYGPVPEKPEELEKDRKWFYPGAAGKMGAKARELGLNVHSQTLRCEVQGMKGPLKEGEVEKASQFTREFTATIGKQ